MTRSKLFIVVAFVLFLLAAFVAGGIISSSFFQWQWLIPGGLASFMLSLLL